MAAEGWTVDNSEVGGSSQDPKIAHPTQEPVKTCDHVYESKVTKEATCTEAGVMTYTCSVCQDSYTEV